MNRIKEILDEAHQRLEVAKSGLLLLRESKGQGRTGVRNVAVFGRMVTFATNNLTSVVDDFKEWDSQAKLRYLSNEESQYMVKLRNTIEKQARTPTRIRARFSFHTDDIARFPEPPGAKGFFMGDQNGGSGWMVDDGQGGEVPFYINLPDEFGEVELILPEIQGRSALEVCSKYIESLESYLNELREFLRSR